MKLLILGFFAICCLSQIECGRDDYHDRYSYDDFGGGFGGFRHREDFDDFKPNPNAAFYRKIPKDYERPGERNHHERGSGLVTEFAWKLFKNSNSQPNYVLSPLSPQILLTYLAWVADGATRSELLSANVYGSPSSINRAVENLKSDKKRELNIATAFFHSNDLKLNDEFVQKSNEKVDVVAVDFKQSDAGKIISEWTKKKTNGALKLNEINYDPSTKLSLASTMYFKGDWFFTFLPAQPGIFNTPSGPVTAPMMNMKRKFRWGKIKDYAEWAAMPYKSEDSLIIILPNEGTTVDEVMEKMSPRDFENVCSSIDSFKSDADVNITMPKFKIESTINLIEPLQKMGVKTLFSLNAELPYLSESDGLQVSNAQQQASIDVNEQGTVLVSVTNMHVIALSIQPIVPDVVFNVNRPFIVAIADRTRYIPYCIAKITNPVA